VARRGARARYHAGVTGEREEDRQVAKLVGELGLAPRRIAPLAGDASSRRFFRVWLEEDCRVVVALYPSGSAAVAAHDAAVQQWAIAHDLPVPRLLAVGPCGTVSEDLGDEHLEAACTARGADVVGPLLATLAAFQRADWHDCPNPPFDEGFFRRELALFAEFAGLAAHRRVASFLDELAGALARHPYRLVHRDFHLHNLFWCRGAVVAVDGQDMRAGPDTYDAASLLRERRGSELVAPLLEPAAIAAACGWAPGWEERLLQCGAQRGLKVIGTFLRLAAGGRRGYLRFLPEACRATREAVAALGAPETLVHRVADLAAAEEV